MAKKLTIMDSGWLTMETPETPMHVGGLLLFKTPENAPADYMQQFLAYLMGANELSAPFNKKLRGLLPLNLDAAWTTDHDLDIEYHIRHTALPKPGRVRELLALVSRLHAQRMDRLRPLWEVYLIEGLEGGRFALFVKIHHSLVDGVAAMRLLQSRLSRTPNEIVPVPWSNEWEKDKKTTSKALKRAPVSPVDQLKAFGKSAATLLKLATTPSDSNVKSIYKAPGTVLNKRVHQARRFAAQSWSLSRIKKVAKAYDATVNDIVLSMCGSALREYLLGFSTLPEQSLVANVPVSVRSADSVDDNGNAISTVQVTLGTRYKDPVSRLRAIQESMAHAKDRLAALTKTEIDANTVLTNLPLLAGQVSRLDGRLPVMFNVVVSNVPGPSQTLYMYGAELLANYPASLIFHGYAMNITVQSYKDNLDFGVIACRESAPKVQRMLDFLENALADLEKAQPGQVGENAASKKEAVNA